MEVRQGRFGGLDRRTVTRKGCASVLGPARGGESCIRREVSEGSGVCITDAASLGSFIG